MSGHCERCGETICVCKPITKEQWAELENQLSGVFGRAELLCDGYKINAEVQTSNMKLVVAIYVNGVFKGEWIINKGNSEIPRKFFQEKRRFVFSAKYRALLVKQSKSKYFSKEERAQCAEDAKKASVHWLPYWPNAKAFCRHIRKTCTSIEIVKIGY